MKAAGKKEMSKENNLQRKLSTAVGGLRHRSELRREE